MGQTWTIYSRIQIHASLLDTMLSTQSMLSCRLQLINNFNANWPDKHYKSAFNLFTVDVQ